jgi:predicted transcriptional regulator
VEIAYELLRFIQFNESSKWDLIKIVGNNRQFEHWVSGFLVEDGFVSEPTDVEKFYRLTEEGVLLLRLLSKGNLMNSLFKLSGSRLRQ